MRNARFSTLISLIALIVFVKAQTGTNGFCNLMWNDEFSGSTIDTTKWQIEQNCYGGGNNELQCYTARPKNIFIDNGNLVLKAYNETYTGTQAGCTETQGCTDTKQFTSGRLNSAISDSGTWVRGRFEIRAKLTSGSHLWPAFWMMPKDSAYGGWAASGEIDIMEQRGDTPSLVSGTLHHGGSWPNNIYTTSGDYHFSQNDDLSADFHIYAVEWTQDTMKWFMDDYNFQTFNLNRWWNTSVSINPYTAPGQPWDKRFFVILNLAVGGGFFGGYPALTDADVAAWKVAEYRIDYVRAWSYTGGTCAAVTGSTPNSASQDSQDQASTPEQGMPGNTIIAIAAGVGGAAFMLGVAGIVVGVIFIVKSRRNLMVPPLTPSGSQEHLKPYPGY